MWLIAKFYFALQGNSFRNWKTLQSFLIDLFIFFVHTVLFYCINSHPHTSKIDQNRPWQWSCTLCTFPVIYSKYPVQYSPGALNKAQKTGSWSAVKCIITFFSCNNFRVSVYIKTTANPNIWFIFNFFFNFYHVIYARFYHTVNYS